MSTIPDFTESQIWTVTSRLKERFKNEVEVHKIDCELRLNPQNRELTLCPRLYWQAGDCNFVIFKTGSIGNTVPVSKNTMKRPARYMPLN